AIRSTDNDAMGSRLSAIMQRYIPGDPFTPMLASNEASTSATISRRSPIINIGTYLRSRAIDRLVHNFLVQSNSPKQILSLGAGSDSRFWRLESDPAITTLSHYVELDFPHLTTAKVGRIRRRQELAAGIGKDLWISEDQSCFQTERYSLIACDLRTLPEDQNATSILKKHLDSSKETLIIAECVLAYLSPGESNALLSFLGKLLSQPSALCYEMCVAGDDAIIRDAPPSRFGSVMLSNLQSRSLDMPGARAFSTLSSHKDRFQIGLGQSDLHGNGKGVVRTLKNVWQGIEEEEKQRLSRLEGLDEVEELEILLAHYAISW
ncbi:S-adenosyl-L-methionine-dependent methyltransferase, partial [Meira miltonrushii]